jgi:hypothetical protein
MLRSPVHRWFMRRLRDRGHLWAIASSVFEAVIQTKPALVGTISTASGGIPLWVRAPEIGKAENEEEEEADAPK